MSILESIKEERKLSFNHWRYRLLHWCFNIKCPQNRYNGLPSFLYTHYCPLFHLTNLIAILSPVILSIKIIAIIMEALVTVSVEWTRKLRSLIPKKEIDFVVVQENDAACYKRELKAVVNLLKNNSYKDFEHFWALNHSSFRILLEDEAKSKYENIVSKLKMYAEEQKLRKEKMKQYLIFWTNFSRVFIKWGLNIAYVGLAIFSLYVFSCLAMPIINLISCIWSWLIECDPMPVLILFSKAGFLTLSIFVPIIILLKFKLVQKFFSLCGSGICLISPPFTLVWDIVIAFWNWVNRGLGSIMDFISLFYEENCPSIVIIDEDEAAIREETK